jgi:tetratricopeptide (TPR) repeat protein
MKPISLLVALVLVAAPAAALAATTEPAAPPPGPTPPAAKTSPAPPATRKAPPVPPGVVKAPMPQVPDYVEHNNKGARLLSQGKAAEAIKEFQKALAIRKDYSKARYNLGLAYLEDKQPDAAAVQFKEVLKNNPKMLGAMDGLAITYALQGKYEKAIAQERKILEIRPTNAAAHYNIACWQAVQKKTEDAFASLEKAVKYGFRNVEWMRNDPDLSDLRSDRARWNPLIQEASKPISTRKIEAIGAPKERPEVAPKAEPAAKTGPAEAKTPPAQPAQTK